MSKPKDSIAYDEEYGQIYAEIENISRKYTSVKEYPTNNNDRSLNTHNFTNILDLKPSSTNCDLKELNNSSESYNIEDVLSSAINAFFPNIEDTDKDEKLLPINDIPDTNTVIENAGKGIPSRETLVKSTPKKTILQADPITNVCTNIDFNSGAQGNVDKLNESLDIYFGPQQIAEEPIVQAVDQVQQVVPNVLRDVLEKIDPSNDVESNTFHKGSKFQNNIKMGNKCNNINVYNSSNINNNNNNINCNSLPITTTPKNNNNDNNNNGCNMNSSNISNNNDKHIANSIIFDQRLDIMFEGQNTVEQEAFTYWKTKHRKLVTEEYPDASDVEIEQHLCDIWGKLPDKYRLKYFTRATKQLKSNKSSTKAVPKKEIPKPSPPQPLAPLAPPPKQKQLQQQQQQQQKSKVTKANPIVPKLIYNGNQNSHVTNGHVKSTAGNGITELFFSEFDMYNNGHYIDYSNAIKETMTYNSPDKNWKRKLAKRKYEDARSTESTTGFTQDLMIHGGYDDFGVSSIPDDLEALARTVDFTDLDTYLSTNKEFFFDDDFSFEEGDSTNDEILNDIQGNDEKACESKLKTRRKRKKRVDSRISLSSSKSNLCFQKASTCEKSSTVTKNISNHNVGKKGPSDKRGDHHYDALLVNGKNDFVTVDEGQLKNDNLLSDDSSVDFVVLNKEKVKDANKTGRNLASLNENMKNGDVRRKIVNQEKEKENQRSNNKEGCNTGRNVRWSSRNKTKEQNSPNNDKGEKARRKSVTKSEEHKKPRGKETIKMNPRSTSKSNNQEMKKNKEPVKKSALEQITRRNSRSVKKSFGGDTINEESDEKLEDKKSKEIVRTPIVKVTRRGRFRSKQSDPKVDKSGDIKIMRNNLMQSINATTNNEETKNEGESLPEVKMKNLDEKNENIQTIPEDEGVDFEKYKDLISEEETTKDSDEDIDADIRNLKMTIDSKKTSKRKKQRKSKKHKKRRSYKPKMSTLETIPEEDLFDTEEDSDEIELDLISENPLEEVSGENSKKSTANSTTLNDFNRLEVSTIGVENIDKEMREKKGLENAKDHLEVTTFQLTKKNSDDSELVVKGKRQELTRRRSGRHCRKNDDNNNLEAATTENDVNENTSEINIQSSLIDTERCPSTQSEHHQEKTYLQVPREKSCESEGEKSKYKKVRRRSSRHCIVDDNNNILKSAVTESDATYSSSETDTQSSLIETDQCLSLKSIENASLVPKEKSNESEEKKQVRRSLHCIIDDKDEKATEINTNKGLTHIDEFSSLKSDHHQSEESAEVPKEKSDTKEDNGRKVRRRSSRHCLIDDKNSELKSEKDERSIGKNTNELDTQLEPVENTSLKEKDSSQDPKEKSNESKDKKQVRRRSSRHCLINDSDNKLKSGTIESNASENINEGNTLMSLIDLDGFHHSKADHHQSKDIPKIRRRISNTKEFNGKQVRRRSSRHCIRNESDEDLKSTKDENQDTIDNTIEETNADKSLIDTERSRPLKADHDLLKNLPQIATKKVDKNENKNQVRRRSSRHCLIDDNNDELKLKRDESSIGKNTNELYTQLKPVENTSLKENNSSQGPKEKSNESKDRKQVRRRSSRHCLIDDKNTCQISGEDVKINDTNSALNVKDCSSKTHDFTDERLLSLPIIKTAKNDDAAVKKRSDVITKGRGQHSLINAPDQASGTIAVGEVVDEELNKTKGQGFSEDIIECISSVRNLDEKKSLKKEAIPKKRTRRSSIRNDPKLELNLESINDNSEITRTEHILKEECNETICKIKPSLIDTKSTKNDQEKVNMIQNSKKKEKEIHIGKRSNNNEKLKSKTKKVKTDNELKSDRIDESEIELKKEKTNDGKGISLKGKIKDTISEKKNVNLKKERRRSSTVNIDRKQ